MAADLARDPGRRRLLLGAGLGSLRSRWRDWRAERTRPKPTTSSDCTTHLARGASCTCSRAAVPSQLDLFDHKPLLQERNGEELPDSVRRGQRLTGMSGNQATLPLAGAQFQFDRYGESRAWISELLPRTAEVVDELCILRTLVTDQINHDPASTFLLSGSPIAGRPSMGAWLSYGLGSLNRDLPEFCVLVTKDKSGQPLYKRMWGSGFLSARHQGVQLRPGGRPGPLPERPEGTRPPDAPPDARRARGDARGRGGDIGRPSRSGPHRAGRARLPHAGVDSGGGGPRRRAGSDVRAVRGGRAHAGDLRGQLRARAAPAGARRPLRAALPPGLGSARHAPARPAAPVPRDPTRPPRRSSPIYGSAACSTIRSSCGAASSGAPVTPRAS